MSPELTAPTGTQTGNANSREISSSLSRVLASLASELEAVWANATPSAKPADAAFLDALGEDLRPDIQLELVEADVNDPEFADLVAERYLALSSTPSAT